jgi:molybdate transport system ATP-binding protein
VPDAAATDSGLSIDIDQRKPVALRVRLECARGRTLALFGASGSGKTSTLRAVAGLSDPAAGSIRVGGEPWFDSNAGINLPTQRRSVGYVFQEYALFPHLSALDNVRAAMGHIPSSERAARAQALLSKMHLSDVAGRRPAELSGGQRQRIAVARALAREPKVLLLDEPFSAVDVGIRKSLYAELLELRRTLAIPIVLVTHDFQEVLRFADTVAVMEGGSIVAHGAVGDMCRRSDLPLIQSQADAASVFDSRVVAHHQGRRLIEISLGAQRVFAPFVPIAVGSRVRIRVPAREVVLAAGRVSGISIHNQLAGVIEDIVSPSDSPTAAVHVRVEDALILAHVTRDALQQLSLSVGAPVHVLIKSIAIDTIELARA